MERLAAELRRQADLDHPNLLRIVDAGEIGDWLCIASECFPQSLEEHLATLPAGRAEPAQALTWAIQAALALQHLHQHGIIHGDLRPSVIFLDPAGNLRIGGAGLASVLRASAAETRIDAMVSQVVARSRAQAGAAATTLALHEHFAPELSVGEEPGPGTDIYALGVLLAQLLCGQNDRRRTHPPSQVVRGLDSRWDAVLARCTAQSPKGRYPSASTLLADLRAMQNRPRRWPIVASAGAVAACIIVGVTWWKPWIASSPQPIITQPLSQRILPSPPTTPAAIEPLIPVADLVAIKVRAERALESAHRQPPDAQVIPILDRAETLFREGAELDARDSRAQALARYEQVLSLAESIESLHAQRRAHAAESARQAMEALDREIDGFGREKLSRHGGDAWEAVRRAMVQGGDDPAAILAAAELAGGLLVPATQAAERAWQAERVAMMHRQAELHIAAARALIQQQRFEEAGQQVARARALRGDEPDALELSRFLRPYLLPKDLELELEPGVSLTTLRMLPGRFTMGTAPKAGSALLDDAGREVTLSRPFYIVQTEVTRGQFLLFVRDTGHRTEAERDGWSDTIYNPQFGAPGRVRGLTWKNPGFEQTNAHPVVCVSWNDAVKFCEWLSGKSGRICRLPTEAEWEYTCRAGTQTTWSWGDEEADGKQFANVLDRAAGEKLNIAGTDWRDRDIFTAPVRSYKSNAWGLFDMHGNVSEWCADVYAPYGREAVVDPRGPESPFAAPRVMRGGSWVHLPFACTSAHRAKALQAHRNPGLGFRIVVEAPDDAPATRPGK